MIYPPQTDEDNRRRDFMRRLVKAGWKRPFGGAGYYVHLDGGVFHHDALNKMNSRVWWNHFDKLGKMPETKGVYT